MSFSKEQEARIIKALEDANVADAPCPRCSNIYFQLAGGYVNHLLSDDLTSIRLGSATIPSIAVICTKCGYMSFHAIGILGLLPIQDKK